MSTYAIYTMYFLSLLYYTRRHNSQFVVDADDIRYILIALVLYCLANLISSALIFLKFKNDYRIANEHFLIVGIGIFLLYKLSNEDDLQNKG